MRWLMLVVAMMVSGVASAGTYSKWQFSDGVTNHGHHVCVIHAEKNGERAISIKSIQGDNGNIHITLYDRDWNIPKGRNIPVRIDFMDNDPATLKSYSDGSIIDVEIPMHYTGVFLSVAEDSQAIRFGFPDENEKVWTVQLKNIRPAMKSLITCMQKDLQQQ